LPGDSPEFDIYGNREACPVVVPLSNWGKALIGVVSNIPNNPDPKVNATLKLPCTLPIEGTLRGKGCRAKLLHWSRDEKKILGDVNG